MQGRIQPGRGCEYGGSTEVRERLELRHGPGHWSGYRGPPTAGPRPPGVRRPLNHGYRIDFIVDQVILEIKAVEHILPVHRAQLLTYLRLKHLPAGLLLNFHAALLRDGIVRIVNTQ